MGKSIEDSDSSDNDVAALVRRNSRFVRNLGNEAESSQSNQIRIPELIDEPDRVGDGGNTAVRQYDPIVGHNRFEGLINLTEESTNRPVYTEADVEAKLIPLGVLTYDLPPVVDWNRGIVGVPTRSTMESVTRMLDSCGLADCGISFVIPRPTDRPWNPPKGYICLYETYFKQCHIWFPLSTLLITFAHRHRLAISQLTPAAICNFVGVLTFGVEGGFRVNSCCFEEMTTLRAGRSPGT